MNLRVTIFSLSIKIKQLILSPLISLFRVDFNVYSKSIRFSQTIRAVWIVLKPSSLLHGKLFERLKIKQTTDIKIIYHPRAKFERLQMNNDK